MLGLVLATIGVRWVAPLLFGVSGHDPLTLGIVCAVLLGVALAAQPPNRRTEHAIGKPTQNQCSTNSALLSANDRRLGPAAESGTITRCITTYMHAPKVMPLTTGRSTRNRQVRLAA